MARNIQLKFDWGKAAPTSPVAAAEMPAMPEETLPATPLAEWDFVNTFPNPLADAIAAGLFGMDKVTSEELKAIHSEHAAECHSLLADLGCVAEAKRSGIDPRTGSMPRTERTRQALAHFLAIEPERLRREFHDLIAEYEYGFGSEATLALQRFLLSSHPDVLFHFNAQEDEPILREELQAAESQRGEEHQDNDRVEDAQGITSSPKQHRYDPGHPWYYYSEGDGQKPIPFDLIPPRPHAGEHMSPRLPKNKAKRAAALRTMLEDQTSQLAADKKRYAELVERGTAALSDYDRNIAHGGNEELAWASAVALKYNHIRNGRGRMEWLQKARSQRNA